MAQRRPQSSDALRTVPDPSPCLKTRNDTLIVGLRSPPGSSSKPTRPSVGPRTLTAHTRSPFTGCGAWHSAGSHVTMTAGPSGFACRGTSDRIGNRPQSRNRRPRSTVDGQSPAGVVTVPVPADRTVTRWGEKSAVTVCASPSTGSVHGPVPGQRASLQPTNVVGGWISGASGFGAAVSVTVSPVATA